MEKNTPPEEKFVPYGAIAFTVLLVILTVILWFMIYNLQLDRHQY
ncbi:MAG TPA: hypothetical protein VGI43_02510 [Mucilaginibacter sp.]|jgi:preprotein translocase subunit YajC